MLPRLLKAVCVLCFIVSSLLGVLSISHAQAPAAQLVESDHPRVVQGGSWSSQTTPAASNGSYLYSSGAAEDVLSLAFLGSAIEIIYVAGPSLGTLAIEVDGTVLRTVITTDTETRYGQSAKINYLTDEPHALKVYAQDGGVIAVDAFVILLVETPEAPVETLDVLIAHGEAPSEPMVVPGCGPNQLYMVTRMANGQPGGGDTRSFAMSDNGRYIAFVSNAMDITGSMVNTAEDTTAEPNASGFLYLHDRQNCTTLLLLAFSAEEVIGISDNGRYVFFTTLEYYGGGEGSGCYVSVPIPGSNTPGMSPRPCLDIYRYDRQNATYAWVSVRPDGSAFPIGIQSWGSNFYNWTGHDITPDGNFIAFTANGATGTTVFVRNMTTGVTEELTSRGTFYLGHSEEFPKISDDGRYVVFQSSWWQYVNNSIGDCIAYNQLCRHVYLRDRQTNTTHVVSVANNGMPGNWHSSVGDISGDGRYVVFDSLASNFRPNDEPADLNNPNAYNTRDIFVRDRVAGTTTAVLYHVGTADPNFTQGMYGPYLTLSGDGSHIGMGRNWANFVPQDDNTMSDTYGLNLQTGERILYSQSAAGQLGNNHSGSPRLSADGQAVAFLSHASNLVPNSDAFRNLYARGPIIQQVLFDHVALAHAQVGTANFVAQTTSGESFTISPPEAAAGGNLVLGDWDGNAGATPGVYAPNGIFYYTNQNGQAGSTWQTIWIGLQGSRPVLAGRFDAAVNHDCVGVIDSANFPPYGMAFALYFTCDLTDGTAPPSSLQWLSVVLPDSSGAIGTHQFSTGDFDQNGGDTIAIRRGNFIAWTNVAPMTLLSEFSLAQYFGAPGTGDEGQIVTGDWNLDNTDSFGLVYQNGQFYRRDDLQWNSGSYGTEQFFSQVGTPFVVTIR